MENKKEINDSGWYVELPLKVIDLLKQVRFVFGKHEPGTMGKQMADDANELLVLFTESDNDKPFWSGPDGSIANAAKDYDMDYETVEDIKKRYPETFYEELEVFIKNRANRNNNP